MTKEPTPDHLDIDEILRRLPHRYPFLMIDRVTEIDPGKRAVGYKNISINEPHFQGHFPGNPIMPGVLIMEALAQIGGVVVSAAFGPEPRVGFLAGLNNAKFRRAARPGDRMKLEVEVISCKKALGKVRGVASVDDQVVAEGEILFVFES